MKSESTMAFPSLTTEPTSEETLVAKLLAENVDRLGGLSSKYQKAKELVAEYDKLRKLIESDVCKPGNEAKEVTVRGEKFQVVFTPGTEKREVADKVALFQALGEEKFVELAKFTLGDVDDYCTPIERAKILKVEEHGGSRRHTVAKRR